MITDTQERDPDRRERVFAEAVPLNGADSRADWRAHLRELTTARQAAERHLRYPPIPPGIPDRLALMAWRVAAVRAILARTNAEHQRWLGAHGEWV